MCFQHKSNGDPKVLHWYTGIKSKRSSSRMDMHREAKKKVTSLAKRLLTASRWPVVSRSSAVQRDGKPFKRLKLHQKFTTIFVQEKLLEIVRSVKKKIIQPSA